MTSKLVSGFRKVELVVDLFKNILIVDKPADTPVFSTLTLTMRNFPKLLEKFGHLIRK
jgi:hypothetical protein